MIRYLHIIDFWPVPNRCTCLQNCQKCLLINYEVESRNFTNDEEDG